jgi:hypothetical protein
MADLLSVNIVCTGHTDAGGHPEKVIVACYRELGRDWRYAFGHGSEIDLDSPNGPLIRLRCPLFSCPLDYQRHLTVWHKMLDRLAENGLTPVSLLDLTRRK